VANGFNLIDLLFWDGLLTKPLRADYTAAPISMTSRRWLTCWTR